MTLNPPLLVAFALALLGTLGYFGISGRLGRIQFFSAGIAVVATIAIGVFVIVSQ